MMLWLKSFREKATKGMILTWNDKVFCEKLAHASNSFQA